MKAFLLPYKQASKSCRVLAGELGIKRIKINNSGFKPSFDRVVVNWGSSLQVVDSYHWINHPACVAVAASKMKTFAALYDSGVPCPRTLNLEQACNVLDKGEVVMARERDRGHSGEGIYVVKNTDQFYDLMNKKAIRFLTEYFKGREEYRIHVCRDEVVDVQQKCKRADAEEVNYYIRSHANGFVFCREGVEAPECVRNAAVHAVAALGLDFGAVDVKYNEKSDTPCVLEVNTAPGLEGTTLQTYKEFLLELISELDV